MQPNMYFVYAFFMCKCEFVFWMCASVCVCVCKEINGWKSWDPVITVLAGNHSFVWKLHFQLAPAISFNRLHDWLFSTESLD